MWKVPAQGGAAIQVTRNGGGLPVESPDGKSLYFAKGDGATGPWKMPVEGGPETQVVKAVYRANFVCWIADSISLHRAAQTANRPFSSWTSPRARSRRFIPSTR